MNQSPILNFLQIAWIWYIGARRALALSKYSLIQGVRRTASRYTTYIQIKNDDNSQSAFQVNLNSSDNGKEDKPEPKENIDLLIDDVEGEDAESINFLHRSRRTVLVEGTFCDLQVVEY